MFQVRAASAAFLLALAPTLGHAGDPVPGVLAALRAATGCTAWSQLAFVHVDGAHAGDGLDGPFTLTFDARDGRYATVERSGGFSSGDGFDGAERWERDFSATAHVMDAPSALADARSEAWMRAYGWCRSRGARYALAGTARATSGATDDVLAVRPDGGAQFELYVDRSTHLPDRTAIRHDENHDIVHYADWRDVNGVAMPFRIRRVDPEDEDAETMTIRSVRAIASVAPLAFAAPPTDANVSVDAPSVTVPYVVDGNKPIVEVRIDGQGPFPFVVDTGGHFILTKQTADRLGLTGRGAAASVNQGTVHRVGFARVARLQIGSATITHQVAEINPYGFTKLERGPRPAKAGWLGLEFFERFAVTFDPLTRTMTMRPLTSPRPPAAGTRLPIFFDEDSPLTSCSIARFAGACMLDTGNASDTIAAGIWAQRSGAARVLAHGIDVSGELISRRLVSIGPFDRPGALVSYVPESSPDAELFNVEAAILSFALIDGFTATFDYGKRGLWLQPTGSYAPQPFNRTGVIAAKRPDGTLVVRAIIAGSPAAAAGIRSDDVVLALDGVPARRLSGADFSIANATAHGPTTYEIVRGSSTFSRTLVPRDLLPRE